MNIVLPVQKRLKHFEEEERVLNKEEAITEAKRCEMCENAPCESASPLGLPVRAFLRNLQDQHFDEAYRLVKIVNPFPKISSKICDAHALCEKGCKLDKKIQIRRLQRFICEQGKPPEQEKVKLLKKSIGIVGAGPAGLACAAELSKKGYFSTVYDALPYQGGHLTMRIPLYKLSKETCVEDLGKLPNVTYQQNTIVGKTVHLAELQQKHDAIFLALGANTPQVISIPGIEKGNVFLAHDLLMRVHHFQAHEKKHVPLKIGKHVVVLGSSEVALDTARTLRRLGTQVTLISEQDYSQITAHHESLKRAQEEEIQCILLTQVEKILGKKDVESVQCIQMMAQQTESGEVLLSPLEGSTFTIPCDQVYLALGQHSTIFSDPTVKIRKSRTGKPIVNEHLQTSEEGIFAGGEMRLGKVTLEETMADGKKAAQKIHLWLNNALQKEDDDDVL
ncbi:FAD-dependent oxidoreductase [Candidatus Woesearchaeota archaeon]|nr:FAD-dependent oxidoreductase [Candidatus Woesearchaeota archaeon]